MANTQTTPWDPAEHLETEEDMAAYLNVALEEGDLSLIMATLGDIARTKRMTVVAQEAGLGRESLYKSLSSDGNPEFATVLKVVHALGLRLHAMPTASDRRPTDEDMGLPESNTPTEHDGIADSVPLRRVTKKRIATPRLEIGGESFSQDEIAFAEFQTHTEGRSQFNAARVTLNPRFRHRWDYRAGIRLYEHDELIFTGICSESKLGPAGELHLQLWGLRWYLERTSLQKLGTFGMSNKENFYWLTKFFNPETEPVVEGLELGATLRPFMFAVPLKHLTSSGNGILLTMDTGIASHEYDNVFKPLLAQFSEIKDEPAWQDDTPKLFGTVFAETLLEADRAARDRAELMVGIINLSLRTGISHFDTRYSEESIEFNAEPGLTPISMYPWIIIREVSESKGWLREIPTSKLKSEVSLDDALDRIRLFLSKFDRASEFGDIYDQLGRRKLSPREQKLLEGTNRALRWLNTASSEEDIRDSFTATWIALEAILNAISYPGVFGGARVVLREDIRNAVRQIELPSASENALTISRDMLENRILNDDWSLSRKLRIFANSFGITLQSKDYKLVGELSGSRNTIFHEGNNSPGLSQDQLNHLRYLVERLAVGASIGGYEDMEDSIHQFHVGTIGPEGGGAPITIDGKEDVPYELHATRNLDGELVAEWIAEGKIYSDKNVEFVWPSSTIPPTT